MVGKRGKGSERDVLLVCWAEADAAELALEPDAVVVVRRVGLRVPGGSALRLGVVVVVWRVLLTFDALYWS
jgi:hypothetical protein